MAHLCNLGLLILPAVLLNFQFTICTGVLLGEQCTMNTNCTANVSNSECAKNKTCQCVGTFYQQNNTCQAKVPLGGPCTMNTSCTANVSNSECKNKTCQCAAKFYQQHNTCQAKKPLGVSCNAEMECSDVNAICDTNCTCKPSHYKDNSKACQQQVPLGGPCTMNTSCTANVSNSECKNKTCQCAAKFYQQHNTCQAKVPLGGPCTMNTSCTANVSNSECKNKTCQCAAKFYQQHNTCQAKKRLGVSCNAEMECSDVNAICDTNCTCKPSHYKDNSKACQQRIYPNMTCASSAPKNASCVANAFCNSTNVCVCRIGYKATATSCNSSKTMAVVEISTMIICCILAYLGVRK